MIRFFSLLFTALLVSAPLHAQTYPSQPISLVVPFGPGSATDIYARMVAQNLQEALGQSVLVENKPGGNAAIAANYVARSKPDGYTLMVSTASAHAANVSLMKNLQYDPVKDFSPVSWIGTVRFFVAVNADSPYKTFDDLIADARKNPGKLSFGNSSASAIVASRAIVKFAGVDMIHVAYKSSPQAMTDLLGNRLTVMIGDFAAAAGHLASGKLRALAVTGITRSELHPEVPTLDELGMKGFDLIGWFGIFAPAGTPVEAIDTLSKGFAIAMAKPELKTRMNQMGYEVFSTSPDGLRKHTQVEIDNWKRYVAEFNITMD
jgi:tripartite-type tricarboxylate transporter receptor subunit TctC